MLTREEKFIVVGIILGCCVVAAAVVLSTRAALPFARCADELDPCRRSAAEQFFARMLEDDIWTKAEPRYRLVVVTFGGPSGVSGVAVEPGLTWKECAARKREIISDSRRELSVDCMIERRVAIP